MDVNQLPREELEKLAEAHMRNIEGGRKGGLSRIGKSGEEAAKEKGIRFPHLEKPAPPRPKDRGLRLDEEEGSGGDSGEEEGRRSSGGRGRSRHRGKHHEEQQEDRDEKSDMDVDRQGEEGEGEEVGRVKDEKQPISARTRGKTDSRQMTEVAEDWMEAPQAAN
ncbi:hypothetical protein CBR_g729 [Chara braunii]|uniref:Uncharacterized protein n=1 Tax=Chara braunii TaxID=69332 RepID=A0A388KC23_CHABU|nr:hypothetical protein CBR_g729 [Chara braunii]|eukprot:GBG67600.1 hypothetical protein CBR_g729 [Chara braunii]